MNDILFYETVIKKEEPPYEFKILLFLDNRGSFKQDDKDAGEKKQSYNTRDINIQVMAKLSEYNAINIKDFVMQNHSRHDKG